MERKPIWLLGGDENLMQLVASLLRMQGKKTRLVNTLSLAQKILTKPDQDSSLDFIVCDNTSTENILTWVHSILLYRSTACIFCFTDRFKPLQTEELRKLGILLGNRPPKLSQLIQFLETKFILKQE